jgi:hypothetical protein
MSNETLKLKDELTGQVVKSVYFRPFPDGRGGYAHNPIITFEDGTELTFFTQETEDIYGTSFIYRGDVNTIAKQQRRRIAKHVAKIAAAYTITGAATNFHARAIRALAAGWPSLFKAIRALVVELSGAEAVNAAERGRQ